MEGEYLVDQDHVPSDEPQSWSVYRHVDGIPWLSARFHGEDAKSDARMFADRKNRQYGCGPYAEEARTRIERHSIPGLCDDFWLVQWEKDGIIGVNRFDTEAKAVAFAAEKNGEVRWPRPARR